MLNLAWIASYSEKCVGSIGSKVTDGAPPNGKYKTRSGTALLNRTLHVCGIRIH